jgi:hypothetical protein
MLSELVDKAWITTATFILEPDTMGIRHVVLSLPSCDLHDTGYLYIHDDKVSETNASANGHYHCHFIRHKFRALQVGQNPPFSHDTSEDSSQPITMLRRMAEQPLTYIGP